MGEVMRHIGRKVTLGENVRIWHFTYIGDNTEIGDNTNIGSLAHIDYNVKIGRNRKIEGAAYIPPLTVIEDDVFIGPCVIFTNDPYLMSKRMIGVHVERGADICAGAVLKAGVRDGADSVFGIGAVVTKDVPSRTVVYGNPARLRYPVKVYEENKRAWEEASSG